MSKTERSLGRGTIIRADQVPDFIRQAAGSIAADQALESSTKRTASTAPKITDTMPFATARKVVAGLKHIGKGVYEDAGGQVWWREGNTLKRHATDRDRLVSEHLAECRAKESRKAQKACTVCKCVDGKCVCKRSAKCPKGLPKGIEKKIKEDQSKK